MTRPSTISTMPIADLFSVAGIEMPLMLAPPKPTYVPPAREPDPRGELFALIITVGDQGKCARIMAKEFPDADRADMEV